MNKTDTQKKTIRIPHESGFWLLTGKKALLIYAVAAAVLTVVLYFPVIYFSAVNLDDNSRFIGTYMGCCDVFPEIAASFKKAFAGSFYRPLLNISLVLEGCLLRATTPHTGHIVNILLHSAAVVMLLFLLRAMGFSPLQSFWGAAVCAVHPVLVPATAWIPGRNDSLVAFFIFGAIASYIVFMSRDGRRRRLFASLHLIAFAGAVFSKETGLMIIPVCLGYGLWVMQAKSMWRRSLSVIAGWIIVSTLFFFMRTIALGRAGTTETAGAGPFLQNLPGLTALAGKVLFPIRMSGCPQLDALSVTMGIAVAALLIAMAFIMRGQPRRLLLWGIAASVFFLAPTAIIKLKDLRFAYLEHRAFPAMAGIITIGIAVYQAFLAHRRQLIRNSAAILVVFLLFMRSITYLPSFSNPRTFWERVKQVWPQAIEGYQGLGKYYFALYDFKRARSLFESAWELDSTSVDLSNSLSAVNLSLRNPQQAERYARSGISINPDYGFLYVNLGAALYEQNKMKEAERAWQSAIRLMPQFYKTYGLLIRLYFKRGDAEQAREIARQMKAAGGKIPDWALEKLEPAGE
jgi:pentatricopeptide repeat protein